MQLVTNISGFEKLHARLCRRVYRDDPNYKDSTSPLLRLVLNPDSAFAGSSELNPIAVIDEQGAPVAAAVLICADNMNSVIQISFFEALPGQPHAVRMLIDEARQVAIERNASTITAGLDGHVNNGLGYLAGHFDKPASFGSAYNPSYYIDYMEEVMNSRTNMSCYKYDIHNVDFSAEKRIAERVSRGFTFRTADFSDLRAEVVIYTDLNNRCFDTHPLYFTRTVDEDLELFKSFGPFLKEENFIVAERDGKPVGFLLWYPDFNELVRPGGSVNAWTAVKYRILNRHISRLRLAEFGVIPEYQSTGVILGLINMCRELTADRFDTCESGWVVESNLRSKGIGTRWAHELSCEYAFYTTELT